MVYQKTRLTLQKEHLAPKKSLGQNFLVHEHTAKRIAYAADLTPDDTVIEVGVGLGALTKPLSDMSRKVIGLEADSGIVRMHNEQHDLPANVELRHADALKTDLKQLAEETGKKLKIVANLPYSISTPFIFRLIENHSWLEFAVVMLQKEVALRLSALPGTKEYGAPTVLLAGCASVIPLFLVKPAEFHPRPKVDSMVIKMTFHPRPKRVSQLPSHNAKLLRRLVNAAFNQRRKTLLNSLSNTFFPKEKQKLASLIEDTGISPSIRAEKLQLEDFVALVNVIEPEL